MVVDTLAEIREIVDRLPASARKRELHAQACSYEQATTRWNVTPPSDAQLEAMAELVMELRTKAVNAEAKAPGR